MKRWRGTTGWQKPT